MDQTKIDVIAGVLSKEMDRNRELVTIARREMFEHNGAAQVLGLLAKQMPGFAADIEKRIEGDPELGAEAEKVRIYVKNIIARFHVMCESQALHQSQQRMICEGRAQAAEQTITVLEKEVAMARVATTRRDELETERRAAEDAASQKVAEEIETPRKTRADKGMPRKKRAG